MKESNKYQIIISKVKINSKFNMFEWNLKTTASNFKHNCKQFVLK